MGERDGGQFKEFSKVLELLTNVISSFTEDVSKTKDNINEIVRKSATINANIEQFSEDIKELFDISKENQKQIQEIQLSLKLLQQTVALHSEKQEKAEKKEEKEAEQRISLVAADKTGKWGVRISMITALASLIGTIIVALLNYYK